MLRFGVSRAHSGVGLIDGMRRFSELLSAALGLDVKAVVTSDYQHLLSSTLDGSLELAWMPPIVHARARLGGATLAAVNERGGVLAYRSALLVRADDAAQTLPDLRGGKTRAAWTDASSAAGYLFPRLLLLGKGVDPDRDFLSQRFCGSAGLACAAVADGEADLCASFVSDAAVNDRALAVADVTTVFSAASWRLRVLAITDSIPPDGFVLAKKVPATQKTRIKEALLQFHHGADGARALKQLMNSDRLVPPSDAVLKAITNLGQQLRTLKLP